MKTHNRNGFSIPELIVVILLIAVVAAGILSGLTANASPANGDRTIAGILEAKETRGTYVVLRLEGSSNPIILDDQRAARILPVLIIGEFVSLRVDYNNYVREVLPPPR